MQAPSSSSTYAWYFYLLSLIIYPRRILDAIDLEYPTWGSGKPDSSTHLRFPGIYVHNYSRPRPMCSTSGMRYARPRGLDLSLAAIYDKVLKRKDFRALSTRRRIRAKIKRRRRTTGNENVCIHLFCMCGAILTVNLGKTKAEQRKRLRKRTVQRLARMLGTS